MLFKEFFNFGENIVYFVIKRILGYFYYYVMIGWKNLKIKCLEYYVCFICRNKGIGEVVKRDILKIEVEEVIKLKSFYVIEVLDYLKLDGEKKRVVE